MRMRQANDGGGAGQDGWLAVWLLACAYGVWLCCVMSTERVCVRQSKGFYVVI